MKATSKLAASVFLAIVTVVVLLLAFGCIPLGSEAQEVGDGELQAIRVGKISLTMPMSQGRYLTKVSDGPITCYYFLGYADSLSCVVMP